MSAWHAMRRALPGFLALAAIACCAALFIALPCSAGTPDAAVPEEDAAPRVIALGGDLRIGQPIDVYVSNLRTWSQRPGNSPWQLVPYVNGRPLKGLTPTSVNLHLGRLQYDLTVTDDSRRVWVDALSPPTLTRSVRFSVGLERQDPFDTHFPVDARQPARLVVLEPILAALALSVALLSAAAFLALATTTSLLTETFVNADGSTTVRFSLAKSQLAIWFFAVFVAFIVIWLATGNYASINVSILSLLGISAGTAVGDAYLQSRNIEPVLEERNVASPPAAMSRRRRRAIARFARDLLCDSSGYSIYRFQMLVWTAVLVMVFISSVYYYLAMPTFNPELIYLMGLSSGTYVANRVPEIRRQAREAEAADGRTALALATAPAPAPTNTP